MNTEPVLSLVGVGKRYTGPPSTRALAEIDLVVHRGEYLSIVGPSGSGKSTLLNLIGAFDRPTEGTLTIDDQDVSALSDRRLAALRGRAIGFVFQSFNLIDGLDTTDNVALGLVYAGIPARQRRARAGEAIERVGLTPRARHRPSGLSGGERQRVAIARAIVTDPTILLADEPTGNLDSVTGEAILQVFDDLHTNGATILLVTHDMHVADRAQRRVEIRDGRIVTDTRAPDRPCRRPANQRQVPHPAPLT